MTSFKPYPSYKESGIGWIGSIPETWSLKKTKYLFRIEKRIVGELGHDVLSITQKGIKVKDVESGGGQLAMDYSKYQLVRKGDFAMNHMDLLTGYVDISKYDGVISPDYRVFQLKDKNCDPNYFLYLYQKAYWDKLFYPLGQGSSQLGRWRFPSDEFNLFQWPIPPKKEQTAIANFLDSKTAEIQAFIALKEKTIELLKERKTAIINQAVTKGLDPNVEMKDSGIEWLGQIPKHWEVKPFTKCVKSKVDYRGKTPEKSNEGIFLVTARNIKEGKIDYFKSVEYITQVGYNDIMKRGLPELDDILFTMEAPLGEVALVDREDVAFAQRIIKFRVNVNLLIPKYVVFFFQSKFFQSILESLATGSTALGIKASKLHKLTILKPPISEQKAINDFILKNIEETKLSIEQTEKEIDLIIEYQQSLISEAVTGKIDVRDWEKSSKSYATSEAEDKLSMAAEESPQYERNTRH